MTYKLIKWIFVIFSLNLSVKSSCPNNLTCYFDDFSNSSLWVPVNPNLTSTYYETSWSFIIKNLVPTVYLNEFSNTTCKPCCTSGFGSYLYFYETKDWVSYIVELTLQVKDSYLGVSVGFQNEKDFGMLAMISTGWSGDARISFKYDCLSTIYVISKNGYSSTTVFSYSKPSSTVKLRVEFFPSTVNISALVSNEYRTFFGSRNSMTGGPALYVQTLNILSVGCSFNNFSIYDIDECSLKIDNCSDSEICQNTPGNYTCLNNATECSYSTLDNLNNSNWNCVNGVWEYTKNILYVSQDTHITNGNLIIPNLVVTANLRLTSNRLTITNNLLSTGQIYLNISTIKIEGNSSLGDILLVFSEGNLSLPITSRGCISLNGSLTLYENEQSLQNMQEVQLIDSKCITGQFSEVILQNSCYSAKTKYTPQGVDLSVYFIQDCSKKNILYYPYAILSVVVITIIFLGAVYGNQTLKKIFFDNESVGSSDRGSFSN